MLFPMDPTLASLIDFTTRHPRLFVLTGAGCSTDAGIPDYRDVNGDWKRPSPVTYQAFTGEDLPRLADASTVSLDEKAYDRIVDVPPST